MRRRATLEGLVVLGLAAAVHTRTVAGLWTTWTTNDNYSHGPLVPVVAGAMAWSMRDRLAVLPRAPDARGLILVATACALQLAGVRADVFALQGWALLVLLFGLSLTFLGRPMTRALAFPIGYLGFMLTFPPVVMNQLSFALKEIAVAASTALAEALGVTLQRSGMAVRLASGTLRIENPCSGLRSLLALLATGAAFAFVQPGSWWRKALLVVLAVPIAMIANAVRLTVLLLVGHYGDVALAAGRWHDVSGYLIYVVALAGLFLARAWLVPRSGARVPAGSQA